MLKDKELLLVGFGVLQNIHHLQSVKSGEQQHTQRKREAQKLKTCRKMKWKYTFAVTYKSQVDFILELQKPILLPYHQL